MKKTFLKKLKMLALLLVAGTLLGISQNVNAVAQTISVGEGEKIGPYIDGVEFHDKVSTSGTSLYCVNRWKYVVKNTTATLVGEKDAGYAYLIANGYPNKTFTGKRNRDTYITQTAFWWYIDEINGNNSSLSKAFKTTAADSYNLRPYIKQLVDGALAARKAGYAKTTISLNNGGTSMSLSSDGKYYVSSALSVTSTNIKTFNVSVTGAPSGTIVTDTNGTSKTSFASNAKFYVKVPASKVTEKSTSITVTVSATGTVNKVYEYQPKDPSMQNFIPSILVPETTNVSAKTNISVVGSRVIIQKVDKSTGKELAGAKLVVKNSSGKTVESFTSTTSGHIIRNLPNGSYTIEETAAPDGYAKLTSPVSFKITDTNKDITVKVENTITQSQVTIQKLDKATNKPVAGAKLVIKNSSGKIVDTFTTTTNAYVKTGLSNGKYTVEEIEAPKGYQLSNEVSSFEISNAKRTATVKFYNESIESQVSISKLDKSTEQPIAGAKLVLKDSLGNIKATWVSTIEPHIIKGLANGTYTVEEIEAPKGYELSTEKVKFTINDDSKTVPVKFYNVAKQSVVTITKIDKSTGNTLAGAVLVIRKADGTEVARFTTTTAAYTILNLEYGTYTVEEESAPSGYKLSSDVVTFKIDADNLTQQITFENYPEIPVPDTASTSSIIMTIIGLLLTGSAVIFIRKNARA